MGVTDLLLLDNARHCDPGSHSGARGLQQRDATDQPKTAQEIRVIYDRWVLERRCLMDFGYTPTAPPSFAEFLATWTTGPWLPVEGIGVPSLAAEASCGLEMLR